MVLDILVMKFAEDTKDAKVIEGEEERQKLQQVLDCLCDWADRWGKPFNFEKCKIMHTGRHNHSSSTICEEKKSAQRRRNVT
jgi:hypothetical protein